ncbi:MAG: hypothetical protein II007_08075 [Gammaproteobacteria bacterium]|nr:hypothetical protein [Gammaproteobacteria bacterium]
MTMEQRVAGWITSMVLRSYIAGAMVAALLWVLLNMANGHVPDLASMTTIKWLLWSGGYVLSLYLVYSLASKSRNSRLAIWLFSILFHLSLLFYIAIILDAGILVLLIGLPEAIITILSAIGLTSCIRSQPMRSS